MNRKPSVDGREVPSIIEEIVIYDKPNKPLPPQDIFPQPSVFSFCKGDIILSRIKSTASSSPSNESTARTAKEKKVKNEPFEIQEILEYESESEDLNESSSVNIKTERSLESSVSVITNDSESECVDDDSSEVEESIENISKEIFKSSKKSSNDTTEKEPKRFTRKAAKATEENEQNSKKKQKVKEITETNKKSARIVSKEPKDSPFKKPRGRPRKSEVSEAKQQQQSTILNFIIRHPKNASADSDKNTDTTENQTGEVRQKRMRRRPKKYEDEQIIIGEPSLEYYSDEDVTFTPPSKKKKLGEVTIVPLYGKSPSTDPQNTSTANINELLDEAQEQMRTLNEVEVELQNLVEDGQLSRKTPSAKKSTEKNIKKAPANRTRKADQQKSTDTLDKNIKKEVEEESDEFMDASHEEEYESDEDSRKEWVPEEYAEYKKQHMKLKNKMHKCKFCGAEFGSYYSLRKHRALDHDDVGKDRKESTYKAPNESEEVQEIEGESDEESRGEWMPEDYAEYKLKHNLNKMKRSQWYKCKICCAVFSNYYKLSKHRVEHGNKPDPYECKQCEAKFGDVDSLTAHIRIHLGKDPYKCKKCDKGFKTKEELIAHIPVHILKKAPTLVKRFRCDLCGKEFSKLCDIERHTRVHTGEKPCECNICHKRFQQSHNLSKHLLTHLHVKPFQCEICNKKFGRIDVLNRHLLTHSMEKPFKCELCNKGFIRQVQLNNHTEKFHPEVDLTVAGLDNVTDEVTVTPLG